MEHSRKRKADLRGRKACPQVLKDGLRTLYKCLLLLLLFIVIVIVIVCYYLLLGDKCEEQLFCLDIHLWK